MEEIQSQSDHYRSSSSSASSPASRVPSSNFFYLRKPGSLRQPISFEDSPDWEDTDIEVRVDEGGDSINAATTPASPSLSKLNSGSLPSPPLPDGAVITRKIAGASIAWYNDCNYGTCQVREINALESPFSVSALLMMVTLKKLASTGCTLIFTIYQSSTEVFGLFDRICLLSNGNTLFFGETLACLQHFSNAGFPCPIMQSPSDHFLRAINTEFDRIIAMCKSWQDDHGDLSAVNMDTAVAIRTLEATYKSSADAVSLETMIVKLTEKTRVAAIFVFVSFTSLLSIAGVPFLFLISISSSLVFYFLVGLRDEFSMLMYFVLNFFTFLLVNEGLVLAVTSIWQDIFWSILIFVSIQVMMMLSAGFLRIRSSLPGPVWMYPISYIAFHTYSIQGLLENEYIETSFAVGQVRTISGNQALQNVYDISADSNSKWKNLLVLFLMAVAYRVLVFVLLKFYVRKNLFVPKLFLCNQNTRNSR